MEQGCPINARTFACAAFSGDITLLEFLDAVGCPRDEVACLAAVQSKVTAGRPAVLRWLSRHGLRREVVGRRTVARARAAAAADVLNCLRDLGAHGVD